MRGLRLFIRPLEASDSEALSTFLAENDGPSTPFPIPARGLLGKLLGEIVAVALLDDEEDGSTRIDRIVVKQALRKKRIGRAMVREAAARAKPLGRRRLVAAAGSPADGFFRSVGFGEEGERWVLDVSE